MLKKILIITMSIMMGSSLMARAFGSASLGGYTGLITTPTAYTAWDGNNFGIDFAYHHIGDSKAHIPNVTLNLLKRWEVGGAFDYRNSNSNDFLLHTKLRFSPWNGTSKSAMAIGARYGFYNRASVSGHGQIYLVSTYYGLFFSMPAMTSMTIGKSFSKTSGRDIDFSMGFDLTLFPKYLKGYVHWLTDFANYSYSAMPAGASPNRGIFNTGVRLAVLKNHRRMKWNIDLFLLDGLDSNRSWSIGTSFGFVF